MQQTGDNPRPGRGIGWGGGVGLAVGMFAPPLLASVAVGAVAGGVIGRFVDHQVENEIHDKIGENLPPGSAGIIGRSSTKDQQTRRSNSALQGRRCSARSSRATRAGLHALKDSLAEAMGKFQPEAGGGTRSPIRTSAGQ